MKGSTLIELVMVMVIAGILASAFVELAVPAINLFFFLPQRTRVQNTAADLLDTVTEGDSKAKGVRFAGSITAASANSLTYSYTDTDLVSHTVVLTYSGVSHTLTRSVDGGTASNIPYYLTSASGTKADSLETNFFRYYTSGGGEMTGGGIVPANIYRVDMAVVIQSGSGKVAESEGKIAMKTGVEIKHYGLPEAPDI